MSLLERTVTHKNDFLVFENALRKLLSCQTRACAFFQSTPYVMLKLDILAFLAGGQPRPPSALHAIPNSPLLLLLLDDGCTLMVKSNTVSASVAASTTSQIAQKEQAFVSAFSRRPGCS